MRGVHLHHATIDTVDLRASIQFYSRYLGLREGWRPDFGFAGAWLYPADGDHPIVHLIEVDEDKSAGGMFNHIAFGGERLHDYIEKLRESGDWFEARPVPGTSLTQVHHFDPGGLRIEVAFDEPLGSELVMSDAVGGGQSILDNVRREGNASETD